MVGSPQDGFFWRVFNFSICCDMLESVLGYGKCHWNLELSVDPQLKRSSETLESSSLSLLLILDNKFLRRVTTCVFIVCPNSRTWSNAHPVLSFLCLSF